MSFLPITREDMEKRSWEQLDFLYISGDAYVDHPSFGHSIITRVLENEGFRVGIIPQPDWKNSEDFMRLGRPKYAVLISSGVIDSMVNHYTASKKPRSEDSYSPGGKAGMRPDRAVIVYSNKVKEVFKDMPVIIGGVEASLRRFAHYDYWDNKVRRSILQDSKADLLIYGMGEKPISEIARELKSGKSIGEINEIKGTAYLSRLDNLKEVIRNFINEAGDKEASNIEYCLLPSFEETFKSKEAYAKAFKVQYEEQDAICGRVLIQKHSERYLVQNPPVIPLSIKEMDRIYALPYERTWHPSYEKDGGIPAITEVEFSITSHRGCYGGCSFCSINFHQGRAIQARSQNSIINEAQKLTWLPGFKGYIHDIGGPTANFRQKACEKQLKHGVCKDKQCLYPVACKNLKTDHTEYLSLLRKLRELPGVKKVFIRSGIRYDYLLLDKNEVFFEELIKHHISGQLKVAPEHVSDRVLEKMGKPGRKVYERFVKRFYELNKKLNKEQYLVPYLISSHPGSDLNAAIELAVYLKTLGYMPEQVQDFYPTPGTLSTTMFYTEIDPRSMKPVYVPKEPREKQMQRALLQFGKRENYNLVHEALVKAGREDLIGFSRDCLIRPRMKKAGEAMRKSGKSGSAAEKQNKGEREAGKRKLTKEHKTSGVENRTQKTENESFNKVSGNKKQVNLKKVLKQEKRNDRDYVQEFDKIRVVRKQNKRR